MIVIAGGIGSGKSVVSRLMRLRGFGVYDCDRRASAMMEGETMRPHVNACLGCDAYGGGKLDRALVSGLIFSNPALRRSLNALVHRAVREDILRWQSLSQSNIFVETAIAAESGILAMASQVWLVEAPREVRLRRVGERDGHSPQKIFSIMEAQQREEAAILASGIPLRRILNDGSRSLLTQLTLTLPSGYASVSESTRGSEQKK